MCPQLSIPIGKMFAEFVKKCLIYVYAWVHLQLALGLWVCELLRLIALNVALIGPASHSKWVKVAVGFKSLPQPINLWSCKAYVSAHPPPSINMGAIGKRPHHHRSSPLNARRSFIVNLQQPSVALIMCLMALFNAIMNTGRHRKQKTERERRKKKTRSKRQLFSFDC